MAISRHRGGGGRVNVTTSQNNVMPAFGNNPNVMCYLDDIYIYLRARSDGALARGRPAEEGGQDESLCEGRG